MRLNNLGIVKRNMVRADRIAAGDLGLVRHIVRDALARDGLKCLD